MTGLSSMSLLPDRYEIDKYYLFSTPGKAASNFWLFVETGETLVIHGLNITNSVDRILWDHSPNV